MMPAVHMRMTVQHCVDTKLCKPFEESPLQGVYGNDILALTAV